MVLIFGAALVAAAAQFIYNRAHDERPAEADGVVKHMRQATGVLGAIVAAVVAVLDALQMIRRVAPPQQGGNGGGGGGGGGGKMFGATVAADVA